MAKLFEVFNLLSKKERRQLRQFLQSPYFTQRKDVFALFDLLAEARQRERSYPSKEKLFRKIFPDAGYDDLRMRALMSDLQEFIEQFVLVNKKLNNPLEARLELTNYYRTNDQVKHFHSSFKKSEKLLEKSPHRNAEYFRKKMDLQTEWLQFALRTKRTAELNLQEISDTLDIFYLISKLRHACTQLSHQKVFQREYDFGFLPAIIKEVESRDLLQIPAVGVYYYCFRFLSEAYSLEDFQAFRTRLFQYQGHFPQAELKSLYLVAVNFCIRKFNEGEAQFAREGLDIYKSGLENKVILEKDRLSRFSFNNIVGFGIQLKEFRWVEAFMKKFASALEQEHQESTIHFNKARLAFARKTYREAMLLLQHSDFDDLVNNLISKTILLKIYFELDEFDLLESHPASLEVFIRRRKLSDYHRKNYRNIIYVVKKILALPLDERSKKEALLAEVEELQPLSERGWLKKVLMDFPR